MIFYFFSSVSSPDIVSVTIDNVGHKVKKQS